MTFNGLSNETHSHCDSDDSIEGSETIPLSTECIMSNLLNERVLLHFDGAWHDFRIEKHRAEYFTLMQRDTASIASENPFRCQGSKPWLFLIGNAIGFDYLIRRRILKRVLLSIANDPMHLFKQICIVMITWNLLLYRLIIHHVFKETDLWKPLLSAQIAVMNCRGIGGVDDPLWSGLMASAKHWEAKHFVFAADKGLLASIGREMMADNQAEMETEFQLQLLCWLAYFEGKCDYETLLGDVNHRCVSTAENLEKHRSCFKSIRRLSLEYLEEMQLIQFIRERLRFERKCVRECGWPPCVHFNEQKVKKKDMKPSFKCGGCKLIRYCCRNHQKKHWKFIHSQQCRAVSII